LIACRSIEKEGCKFPDVDSVTYNFTHTSNSCTLLPQASALKFILLTSQIEKKLKKYIANYEYEFFVCLRKSQSFSSLAAISD
jgi:hypothetical protein